MQCYCTVLTKEYLRKPDSNTRWLNLIIKKLVMNCRRHCHSIVQLIS